MKELTSPEVAEALGVSHEQFSKFWQVAKRFPGTFPEPIKRYGRQELWSKKEIASWTETRELKCAR